MRPKKEDIERNLAHVERLLAQTELDERKNTLMHKLVKSMYEKRIEELKKMLENV